MDRKFLGRFIQLKRKAKNLSQSELNKLLGYEPTSKFISQIERGVVSFPEKKLPLFAAALAIPEAELHEILHKESPNICFVFGEANSLHDLVELKTLKDIQNFKVNNEILNSCSFVVKSNFLHEIAKVNEKVLIQYNAEYNLNDWIIVEVDHLNDKLKKQVIQYLKKNRQYVSISSKQDFIFGRVIAIKDAFIELQRAKGKLRIEKKFLTGFKVKIIGVLF
ncbi:MAG: hypothetical protein A3E74_06330 [Omnitrophica bacterium RIFCSPHIGHO2_12_FULL_44_12]|nr:MAG: hypothetical protein A3B72_05865 [Omnitrophica bacterium RIFCSPHIGHO2_02_FULL_45_28]OGW89759.1 MAG: hypothetical protein A3E74_06330 [Omnitrophica bacterium RIFCSPHIGHO2_12_FULL_44_12]OGX04971.1 MAG: hypothetical protein A3J12_02040 [Omnitrophica bacterium RIFCSPLOWO2_02_FULL_44_11]